MKKVKISDEARDAMITYFSGDASVHYKGDVSVSSGLISVFSKGKLEYIDSPDIVITEGNNVLIIEHFEFDNYKNNGNGSKNRVEQARVDRIAETISPTEDGAMYRDQIQGRSSLVDYEANVVSRFEKHYEKIADYKNKVRELGISNDCSEVKVIFLIEDKAPLGTLVHDGEKTLAVTLANDRRFIEFYKGKPNVDFVIACSSAFNQHIIWIIPYAQLNDYENDVVHYELMEFLSFTPQVAGFKILVPREDK